MEIERKGKSIKLILPAWLSGQKVKELLKVGREAADKGAAAVVLDFSKTEFVDSSCISALISLTRHYKEHNAFLWIENLNSDMLELFEETGIDKLLNIKAEKLAEPARMDIYEDAAKDIRLDVVCENAGTACVLHCSGLMSYPLGSHKFQLAILEAIENVNRIVVECQELAYMDSACIAILVQTAMLLKRTGGEIRIASLNPIICHTLRRLGANNVAEIYENKAAAMEGWKKEGERLEGRVSGVE